MAEMMLQNLYVDNVLVGVNSTEEGIEYYNELKKIFENASMNLREYSSIDSALLDIIPKKDRAKGQKVKVFGVVWDMNADTISVSGFSDFPSESVRTKREMLQAVAKIFDPLGYFSPVVLKFNTLIQRLWKDGVKWDDPIQPEILCQWKKWADEMPLICDFSIPRFIAHSLSTHLLFLLFLPQRIQQILQLVVCLLLR